MLLTSPAFLLPPAVTTFLDVVLLFLSGSEVNNPHSWLSYKKNSVRTGTRTAVLLLALLVFARLRKENDERSSARGRGCAATRNVHSGSFHRRTLCTISSRTSINTTTT